MIKHPAQNQGALIIPENPKGEKPMTEEERKELKEVCTPVIEYLKRKDPCSSITVDVDEIFYANAAVRICKSEDQLE